LVQSVWPLHGVPVGPASAEPLELPDELPLELPLLPLEAAPLDEPPPSSPVAPELAPELAPDVDPIPLEDDPPPEDAPPSPLGVVLLVLPPQPIPMAIAMPTAAQALEAYIRPPP
jgi:hypothetical protein